MIGYPEWWSERSHQNGRGGRGNGRGRGGIVRANAAMVHGMGETSVEAEKQGYTGITNEQWTKLIKLLEDQKEGVERVLTVNMTLLIGY